MMSYFSANQFLDTEVGPGVPPVLALFESSDLEPPAYDQVRKWRSRDSIPAFWLAKIHYALELTGHGPMSFSRYITGGDTPCSTAKPSFSGFPPSVFD